MLEKVLIIGGNGELGQCLMRDLSKEFNVIGTYCSNNTERLLHLDITDELEVKEIIDKIDPNIIVITSAVCNVAFCENNKEEAMRINFVGIKNIVHNSKNRKVIFYSTDAVFDGNKDEYKEEDLPTPLTVYGKSKAMAEEVVKTLKDYLIIRTARFYGLNQNSPKFINTMIRLLGDGKKVTGPINTRGNPTLINDVSRATLELIKKRRRGIYHVAGAEGYTLYETQLKIAEIFYFDQSLITKVERDYGSDFPRISSFLNTEKLRREGIKMTALEEGLRRIKNNITQLF